MPSTATVAHRPRARRAASAPPARSIWESSQPPNISPLGLASAGIAMTRISGMPGGSLGGVSCDDSPATADAIIPPILHASTCGAAGRRVVARNCVAIYHVVSSGFRPDRLEVAMSVPAKQSWLRRALFAGTVVATAAATVATSQPAAAQYYAGYGYGYPAAYPGYGYPAAYPYYPYYYPYYAYGYPYWGWGWGWGGGWGWGHGGWGRGGWGHGGWGHAGWGGGHGGWGGGHGGWGGGHGGWGGGHGGWGGGHGGGGGGDRGAAAQNAGGGGGGSGAADANRLDGAADPRPRHPRPGTGA